MDFLRRQWARYRGWASGLRGWRKWFYRFVGSLLLLVLIEEAFLFPMTSYVYVDYEEGYKPASHRASALNRIAWEGGTCCDDSSGDLAARWPSFLLDRSFFGWRITQSDIRYIGRRPGCPMLFRRWVWMSYDGVEWVRSFPKFKDWFPEQDPEQTIFADGYAILYPEDPDGEESE